MTDIDSVALEAARKIEDLFCKNFDGGRTQRLAAVQVVVAEAMQKIWARRIEQITHLRIAETEAASPSRLYAETSKVRCCSAASPCDHQKRFPGTVCQVCYDAALTPDKERA